MFRTSATRKPARAAAAAAAALSCAQAAAQAPAVTVEISSPAATPGGAVTVSLRAHPGPATGAAGLFGPPGLIGFGGSLLISDPGAAEASGFLLPPSLGVGPVAAAGPGAVLARAAAGRSPESDPFDPANPLLTFLLTVDDAITPGATLEITFDGELLIATPAGLDRASAAGGGLTVTPATLTVEPAGSPADIAEPLGVVDVFDLIAFLVAFSAGGEPADFNRDGAVDVFDLIDFLVAFSTA